MNLETIIDNINALKLEQTLFYHGTIISNGVEYDIHTENHKGHDKTLHIHTKKSNIESKMKYYKYKTKYVVCAIQKCVPHF
jgi:hypothetical protein